MGKKIIFFAAIVATLAGCEVSIKDGKVPAKYLSAAQEYVGIYRGNFEGRQMNLNLSIHSDGVAQMTVEDLNGGANLVEGCAANVGKLVSANVDSKNKELKGISFKFDGSSCHLAGRTVDIQFQTKNDLQVSIVKETRLEHTPGDVDCTDRPNGGMICHHLPGQTIQVPSEYLTGEFRK